MRLRLRAVCNDSRTMLPVPNCYGRCLLAPIGIRSWFGISKCKRPHSKACRVLSMHQCREGQKDAPPGHLIAPLPIGLATPGLMQQRLLCPRTVASNVVPGRCNTLAAASDRAPHRPARPKMEGSHPVCCRCLAIHPRRCLHFYYAARHHGAMMTWSIRRSRRRSSHSCLLPGHHQSPAFRPR